MAAIVRGGHPSTKETARRNVDFIHAYFRAHGPGAVIFDLENAAYQDAEARRIYQGETDPELLQFAAIVARSPLPRAIAVFFVGLSRPRMPLRIVASHDDALVWLRSKQLNPAPHSR